MNKEEIKIWLKDHNITNYTIHPTLVVDVDDVNINSKQLTALPFQFGHVTGGFFVPTIN